MIKISDILNTIDNVSIDNKLSKPYICGGWPRDKLLNLNYKISDIDITTCDESVHELSKKSYNALSKYNALYRKTDNNSFIIIGNIKIDFSSNFVFDNINSLLSGKVNINNITREMFSRDFTCDSLLMTLDLKKIYDPTSLGLYDIAHKKINTCLSPEITFSDRKRVVRAIYLSSKLNFDIDNRVKDWIIKNPHSITEVKLQYLVNKLHKSFEYNYERTLRNLQELGLLNYIPRTEILSKYIGKK